MRWGGHWLGAGVGKVYRGGELGEKVAGRLDGHRLDAEVGRWGCRKPDRREAG